MEFYVLCRTYRMYGCHPTFSLVPDFLMLDAPPFGKAVSELAVTFNFCQCGPPRKTLENAFSRFHANLVKLPKVVFRRKSGHASIDVASQLIDGREWERKREVSVPLFRAAVDETIAAISLLKRRFVATDDFARDAFISHCVASRSRLPTTVEDLASIEVEAKRRRAARLAAMSPWEQLGIDWSDFHVDARMVLDDPFYWNCTNDFAPNGNDTGADLLRDYGKWIRRNPTGDPIQFYDELIRKWGFSGRDSAETSRTVRDEAAVALAFAEFKFRADCRPAVIELALAAIMRQRKSAIDATDWQHLDERLKCLELLERKLLTGQHPIV